ncbi:hypothetical protein ACLOJK_025008 [Asimina triloba]
MTSVGEAMEFGFRISKPMMWVCVSVFAIGDNDEGDNFGGGRRDYRVNGGVSVVELCMSWLASLYRINGEKIGSNRLHVAKAEKMSNSGEDEMTEVLHAIFPCTENPNDRTTHIYPAQSDDR